jgi:UDPglucose--hexose-1-phosphate uridylyltransferase
MTLDLSENSHRRYDPLRGEWVVVSPHRTKRPWQGRVDEPTRQADTAYDPTCYLCPGNDRAGDQKNPVYEGVFVFDNDFAALQPDVPEQNIAIENDLLIAVPERGVCRVICFSPNHSITLSRMLPGEIRSVVDGWADQYLQLGGLDFVNHVQIFENRGEMMGASNPHPHGQIWASESIPNEPTKELRSQQNYFESHGKCLLCDYLALEVARGDRIVCENQSFAAVVPFWAVYPYEALVISKQHHASLDKLDIGERGHLADVLKRLTTRYDNLFLTPFPYSMGFHQAPTDGEEHAGHHLHAHFYPPLLRSATVRKFLVGFELLGSPQRDITPEFAAEKLRGLSELHYLDQS